MLRMWIFTSGQVRGTSREALGPGGISPRRRGTSHLPTGQSCGNWSHAIAGLRQSVGRGVLGGLDLCPWELRETEAGASL